MTRRITFGLAPAAMNVDAHVKVAILRARWRALDAPIS
jgi:hypothetical protein